MEICIRSENRTLLSIRHEKTLLPQTAEDRAEVMTLLSETLMKVASAEGPHSKSEFDEATQRIFERKLRELLQPSNDND